MQRLTRWLATGLGAGYVPWAPGTAGSVVGMGLAALVAPLAGAPHVFFLVAFALAAIWIADRALPGFNADDPKEIVVDEIAGCLVAVAGHPWSWRLALAAFLLFRLLDVCKPFPCRRLEHLPGGFGVVADDLMAACYANVLLWIVALWVVL